MQSSVALRRPMKSRYVSGSISVSDMLLSGAPRHFDELGALSLSPVASPLYRLLKPARGAEHAHFGLSLRQADNAHLK